MRCLHCALRLRSEASPLAIRKQSSMMSCNSVPAVTILRLSTRSNLSAIASQSSQATLNVWGDKLRLEPQGHMARRMHPHLGQLAVWAHRLPGSA